MPAVPSHTNDLDVTPTQGHPDLNQNHKVIGVAQEEEQAAENIFQSVKEQEDQFEQLTRELVAERKVIATQLDKYRFGSETASMSSISSTDESFHWRPPPHDARFEEESETDSKVSGSQLVDSCLRVLQDRGVMDVGDRSRDYMPAPPMSSQQNSHSVTTTTKVVTNHQIISSGSTDAYSNPYGSGYQNHMGPESPAGSGGGYQPGSPTGSARQDTHHARSPRYDDSYQLDDSRYGNDPSNMGRYHGHDGLNQVPDQYDSFDQQFSFRDSGDHIIRQNGPAPQYASRPPDRRSPNPQYGNQYDDRGYIDGEDPYSRGPPQRDLHNSPREEALQRIPDPNAHLGDRGNYPYPDGPTNQERLDGGYNEYPHERGGYNDGYSDRAPNDGRDMYDNRDPYDGDDRFRDRPDYNPQDGQYPGSPRSDHDPYGRLGVPGPPGSDPRYPGSDMHSQRSNSPAPSLDRSGVLRGSQQRLGVVPNGPASFMTPEEQFEEQTSYKHPERSPHSDQVDGPNFDQIPETSDPYSQRLAAQPSPYGSRPDNSFGPHIGGEGNDPIGPDPYGSQRGIGQDPYGTPRDNGTDPYGSQRGIGQDPYGTPRDNGTDPYGSQRGIGQEPYGTPRDNGTDPYGSQKDMPDPYGSLRDNQSEPYGSRRDVGEGGRETPWQDGEGSLRGMPYGEDAPQFQMPVGAPPGREDGQPWQRPDDDRFNNPLDALPRDSKWRDPDLPEVIEFLDHPTDAVKANAAAYLQHLCYRNDNNKAKTRALGGIPALVQLVSSPVPEVHRSACGALRNLSYGKSNNENKREIRKAQGIPALVRLLRTSGDEDVRELVTGILWNLSSCQDLKKPIVDEGLKTIVDAVIRPRWDNDVYCSVVFRNGSGILRNVSSDGVEARMKIRQCDGLVESVISIVRRAISEGDIDNKSVENCVCILRNLSYACQEVQDKDYLQRREAANKPGSKKDLSSSGKDKKSKSGDSVGCFGSSGSSSKKKKDSAKSPPTTQNPMYSGVTNNPKGQELLWHEGIVFIYLPLLRDCTNPETLEATAGAVQNLAACEWQPAEIFRLAFKKEKGLPVIVELLSLEADRVVCSAAMALRNLALDVRNKDLIGKYALEDLVKKLPPPPTQPQSAPSAPNMPVSDKTLCAVIATIFEVIKNSQEFAKNLLELDGVERLVYLVHRAPPGKFSPKAIGFGSYVLQKMWGYSFHDSYKKRGFTQADFTGRPKNMGKSPPPSAENTLHRPRMDQSGPMVAGYNENTLPQLQRSHPSNPPAYSSDTDPYSTRDRVPGEQIPMTTMNSTNQQQGYFPDPRLPPNDVQSGYNRYPDQTSERGNDPYPRDNYTQDLGNPYGTVQDGYLDRDPRAVDHERGGDAYSDQRTESYRDQDPRQDDPYVNHDPPYAQYTGNDARRGHPYENTDPQRGEDPYGSQRGDNFGDDPYDRRREDYRPPGGVPLFPNLPGSDPRPDMIEGEPLYAKVNKPGSRRDTQLDSPPGGADSWV